MIELIFAIVVMGIALLSAPMMLETASKSNNVAFEQESIAIVAAQVSSILTYAWDEQNTQAVGSRDQTLTVSASGDNELDGNNTHPNARRTRSANAATALTNFGMNKEDESTGSVIHFEVIPDDADDFANTDSNLTLAKAGDQTSTQGDIMDTSILLRTTVHYLDDTANYTACQSSCAFSKLNEAAWNAQGDSRHIKLITTELSSTNVKDKKIKLRAFMCNIGAATPSIRSGI